MIYIVYFIDIREFLEKQDENERTRNAQQCKNSTKWGFKPWKIDWCILYKIFPFDTQANLFQSYFPFSMQVFLLRRNQTNPLHSCCSHCVYRETFDFNFTFNLSKSFQLLSVTLLTSYVSTVIDWSSRSVSAQISNIDNALINGWQTVKLFIKAQSILYITIAELNLEADRRLTWFIHLLVN